MKVALDAGDVLDVALLDGDRVIGTLSLQIKGLAGGGASAKRVTSATSERSASAPETGGKKRRSRKPLSPETKARMAAAQKARWEKRRAEEGGQDNSGTA